MIAVLLLLPSTVDGSALSVEQSQIWAASPLSLQDRIEAGDVSTSTIRLFVRERSEAYGVNADLAEAIVRCESGYNHLAKNPHSTAGGLYQFIDSTWEYTMKLMGLATSSDKFDPVLGVEAGTFLLKTEGKGHWLASYNCWGN